MITANESLKTLDSVPQMAGRWLSGNLAEYRMGPLGFLERVRRELGPMAGYRLGPFSSVLVSDPKVLKEILVTRNKEFGRSFATKMLGDFFGEGLLISEGEKWLQDRRAIQPSFACEQIQAFGESMAQQTADHTRDWSIGETRDVLLDMQALTMKIAADTLLGVRLDEEVEAIHDPHEIIRKNFERRKENLLVAPRWVPTSWNRKVSSAIHSIRKIVDSLIATRRSTGQLGPDILSRLMSAQKNQATDMTDEHLRNQAITFLFAGHETTASMLAWVWYLLAENPETEERLHAELDSVLNGRLPTTADVPQLKFTEQIINETLRLYPSAYAFSRSAIADCEVAGFRIPRGTTMVMSPWVMQRDEQFFDEPLAFRPERWTPDFQKNLDQFAWFPFGVGPRVCIGKSFAMMESVLIVATIASRYRLGLVPNQQIKPHASVTIRPAPAVNVAVQNRNVNIGPQPGASSSQGCPFSGTQD